MSEPESEPELVVERRGAVLVARLNRPEARNALTPTLMRDLGAAVIAAEGDPELRVLLLTGTGDRAFCAGLDLRSFAGGDDLSVGATAEAQAFIRLLRGQVVVPVVGAANGAAVAGGLEVLLGCDVIVAADGATFGLPEVKRGLIPGGGGTHLSGRLPLSIALELLLTGDTIDAARAAQLGLVNAVVPRADVLPAALSLAERIAANAPLAVAACKELGRLAAADASAAWTRLEELQPEIFGSEDAKEGALAFVEKRAPVWQGR